MQTSRLRLTADWDTPLGVTRVVFAVSTIYVRGLIALTDRLAAGVFNWAFGSPVFTHAPILLTMRVLTSGRPVRPNIQWEKTRALAQ